MTDPNQPPPEGAQKPEANQNSDVEQVLNAPRRRASVDSAAALLAKYRFNVPEYFQTAGENGEIQQIIEPCYQCSADGFYGRGTEGTWYQEGSVIVTDVVPNEYLRPLNKAAALAYAKWQETLPANRAPIDIADMAEAAQMLAKDPRVTMLAPDDYQAAVLELSSRIKMKRAGIDTPQMSPHNFAPQSGGKSPPILGAKMSDMGARGPGFTNAQAPGGTRQSRQVSSALGGTPPGR